MRVRVHRSRYKCHNRALCNSVDVLTTRVEFPSLPLWLFFFLPFPRPPAALSPPLFCALCKDLLNNTRYEVLTPFAHVTAIKDRFEMTHLQQYRFTLIHLWRLIYSELVPIHEPCSKVFFFFLQKFIFSKFSTVPSKLSEIQVLSVFTISKCPSRIEISNFSDFLASKFARIFRKSFDLHVFETFNIFFFQYSNKFLPNFPISNIKLFEFLLSAL